MLLHYIVRKDIETVAQSVENEFSGKPCSHLNKREKKSCPTNFIILKLR